MKKYIYVLSMLFCIATSHAQRKDAMLWTGISLKKSINKSLSVQLEQQLRFNQNISNVNKVFTEMSITYKVTKFYRVAASYRINTLEFSKRHRIDIDNIFRLKIKPFTFKYRIKLQINKRKNKPIDYRWRNKLTVEYRINKRLTPYLQTELFYRSNPTFRNFDTRRFGVGIAYRIWKKHTIKAFFIREQEFNVETPEIGFINGIKYSFEL